MKHSITYIIRGKVILVIKSIIGFLANFSPLIHIQYIPKLGDLLYAVVSIGRHGQVSEQVMLEAVFG